MNDEPQNEAELQFSDVTMAETEGKFSEVNNLFKEDVVQSDDWCISTRLSIISPFGEGLFELDFRYNKEVYILGYRPSVSDMYQNPDLSYLSAWCQANGWNIPRPKYTLVKDNQEFWKHAWETSVVNSVELETKFGVRATDQTISPEEESEEEL